MFAEDVLGAARKRPFEPFRIQVSDGTTYDVAHPELIMVGIGSVVVGIPPKGQDKPIYEQWTTVSLAHIVKLLPLSAHPAGPGNGKT